VLENSYYKLHYERSIITDLPVHNIRPDIVRGTYIYSYLDNIREAKWINVAIPNSHNLYSTITEKLSTYTDKKEELIIISQLNAVCIIISALSTRGIIPKTKRQLETAKSSLWSIHTQAESSMKDKISQTQLVFDLFIYHTEHMPYSLNL
jgi:hypothetical protein